MEELIVVAPARLFQPGSLVHGIVFGDSVGDFAGTALRQRFVYTGEGARVYGDAETLFGTARGGNDSFSAAGTGALFGDAFDLSGAARGGNDTITATGAPGDIVVETDIGGFPPAGVTFLVLGDAAEMSDRAAGGSDTIHAFGNTLAVGDAGSLEDRARGGDDILTASGQGVTLYGDALFMRDLARGGNDRLTGRADGSAEIVGDAYVIRDGARGGNDRITSVGESTALIGDANVLGAVDDDDFIEAASVGILAQFQASGGNDILIDGDIGTLLLGDAYEMGVRSRGGNDVLKGGGGDDIIVGDALLMNAYFPEPTVFAVEEPGISIGGSDVLFGGTGNDKLYGDALEFEEGAEHGRDRFVFEADSGQDGIADFGRGQDLIDLSRLGVADFADLSIVEDEGTSTIDLGGGNLVRVIGVTGLDASDFIFA